jgi:hypothetical protein
MFSGAENSVWYPIRNANTVPYQNFLETMVKTGASRQCRTAPHWIPPGKNDFFTEAGKLYKA